MSFLRDYLDYATGNEAPDLFHVWSGYAALSAAVSRRVWLVDGDQAIFPNLYVMLVGDAGCGKSTALRRAKRMLAELSTVPISRNVETPEGLWRFMAGDPSVNPPVPSPVQFIAKWPDGQLRECHPMTIIANEFVNFISKDREGWTGALNDIFDEDKYEYRTKNKGEDLLIGPYIVILGALTTDVSHTLQKASIIGTGFARRCIFQYGERKFHEPHSRQSFSAEQAAARQRAFEHLQRVQKLAGEFSLSSETWSWWDTWYNEHTTSIPTVATPSTKGWYTSKPNQVLRLGMLTSLSEGLDRIITIPHLELSVAYLAEMEKDLYQVFGGVGRNELAAVAVKIQEYVTSQPMPISRAVLKTNFFNMCKPPNDFTECMTYLVNSGKVCERTMTIRTSSGAVTDVVVATPEVMSAFGKREAFESPGVVTAPETHQENGSAVGPQASPLPVLDLTKEPRPTVAQSPVETLIGQLPRLPLKE